MNLPNGLTLFRIFLVPLIVAILLTEKEGWEKWAIILVLGAALTDWLDGFLARRRNQVTTLGRLLDPIADKLLVSSAFIALVQLRLVPAWMVVIIIGREFAVSGLRSIAVAEGFTIDASKLGKFKMVSQVISITLLILARKMPGAIAVLAQMALWVVVLSAIVSMAEYFRDFWGRIDERIKYRQRKRFKFLRRRTKGKGNPGPGSPRPPEPAGEELNKLSAVSFQRFVRKDKT